MKIHVPIVYTHRDRKVMDSMELEIPELEWSEVDEAATSRWGLGDGYFREFDHPYVLHDGKLYSPSKYDSPLDEQRWMDKCSSRATSIVGDFPDGKTSKYRAIKSPLFEVWNDLPLVGNPRNLPHLETDQQTLSASPMGRVVAETAANSILIGGRMFRRTVGPVVVAQWHDKSMRVVDGNTSPSHARIAFGIHDLEAMREFARRNRMSTNNIHLDVQDEFEPYDPLDRCLDAIAFAVHGETSSTPVTKLSPSQIATFSKLDEVLRRNWAHLPGNDAKRMSWAYQRHDGNAYAAQDLVPLMEDLRSLPSLPRIDLSISSALDRLAARPDLSVLEDFSLPGARP